MSLIRCIIRSRVIATNVILMLVMQFCRNSIAQIPSTAPRLDESTVRCLSVDWLHGFSEGLGEIEIDGKWGFIDSKGNLVIQPNFDQATGFVGGFANVRTAAWINSPKAALLGLTGKWVLIDKTGRIVSPESVSVISGVSEGLAAVCVGGRNAWDELPKYGYIDTAGNIDVEPKFLWVDRFSEGIAVVQVSRTQRTYIDRSGNQAFQKVFRYAGTFRNGRAVVEDHFGKFLIITSEGDEVAELNCEDVQSLTFHEGLCAVKRKGKWGFVDDKGSLIIDCQFDRVGGFSEGLASFVRDNRIGFINHDGTVAIEPQFDLSPYLDVSRVRYELAPTVCFSEGRCAVMHGNQWGYIDRKGNWLIQPRFSRAGVFTEGFAKVLLNGQVSYVDAKGSIVSVRRHDSSSRPSR